jgi:hypothetical protein
MLLRTVKRAACVLFIFVGSACGGPAQTLAPGANSTLGTMSTMRQTVSASTLGSYLSLQNGQEYPTTFVPYAKSSVFNAPVSQSPQFLANSGAIVAAQFPNPANSGTWVRATEAGVNDYTHPLFFATTADPVVTLVCTQYCNAPDNGGVPKTAYVPALARPAGGTDAHITVVQPDGTEIDGFACFGSPGSTSSYSNPHSDMQSRNWQSGDTLTCANIANLGDFANGLGYMRSGPGSTAADIALGSGVVTAAELIAGRIDHALNIGGQCAIGVQFPAPMDASTKQCSSGVGPPLGGREWYDVPCATTQADGNLRPWEKAILCALNVYGGYFGDSGGGGINFTGGVSPQFESEETWRDYNGTGTNNATYTSPFAALASQGWQSLTISNVLGSSSGKRWGYPGSNANNDWIPIDENGNPINWAAHIHWLAPCSAQGSC